MNIKHSIGLNLSADAIPGRLHMVQGDANSRTIIATLWNGAQLYSIPAGAAIMVRFRKPDGTGGLYDAAESGSQVSYVGSIVTAPVATQMLAVAGDVFAEIDIFGGGDGAAAERLATFRFVVEVAPCVLPDAEIISSDYYNILASKIAEAVAAAERAEQAQSAAAASAEAAATSAANAATSVEGAVKYNAPQTLTDAQKQQARDNIGAPAPYTAGENISISGSVIATKAFPCNPNLLDNGNFQVWQRYPEGTYTGVPNMTYIADRWMFQSSDGSVTNTITKAGDYGIKNASGPNVRVYQRLENAAQYNGRLLTLSVLKGDGSLSYHTGVASGWTETTDIFGVFAPELVWLLTGDTWLAAKLELGSQQTLAHQENGVWVLNEIPNYGEQLRRCQRYCFVWGYGAKKTSCLAVMQCVQPGVLFGLIPTPVTMRNNPVVTGGRLTTFAGNVTSLGNLITCANGIRAVANIEGTSTSQGQAVGVENADDNGRVIFSADL